MVEKAFGGCCGTIDADAGYIRFLRSRRRR
jgi:hypothetical protein